MRRFHQGLLPVLFLAGLASSPNGTAQDLKGQGHPKGFQPLVMLTEFNPWAMVVGSDSPTFVMYENGTVIYLKGNKYVSVRLTQADIDGFVGGLEVGALAKLKDSYSLSDWTDLPTNVLLIRSSDGNYKKISVYGVIRTLKTETAGAPPLPNDLSHALQQVLTYDNSKSSPWMPEYIEVMIWPFEYAKGKVAEWPTRWPGLTDSKTVKRRDAYSIFIPASQYGELKEFISHLKSTEAVRIDNRKWAISARFPFPHEMQ
jgi:hypothetical protein